MPPLAGVAETVRVRVGDPIPAVGRPTKTAVTEMTAATRRALLDLVAWLRAEDARRGADGRMGIVIMSPDYWPLPWYLRDDPKAGFYGSIVDVTAPVQVVKAEQVADLPATFTERYREERRYALRPGVELVVFVERP